MQKQTSAAAHPRAMPDVATDDARIRVSVIVYCEHDADALDCVLRALGAQAYPHKFEVIILDNAEHPGRDKAAVAAARRGMTIRRLKFPGPSKAEAWNIAIRESAGDYLAFLDDDCVPPPGWLGALSQSFDAWVTGIVGGPERIPAGSSYFERCLGYVRTSLAGSMGMHTGIEWVCRYYPKTWNMAARKESVVLSGGFDRRYSESPEVPMIKRLEKIGYRAAYQPSAWVWRRTETALPEFLLRDVRIAAERARGITQPGLKRIYSVAFALLMVLAGIATCPDAHGFGARLLAQLGEAYGVLLAASGLHAVFAARTPIAVILVPALIAAHHAAHTVGYLIGIFNRRVL
jgi:glycosyltransferase involved in cell wall biosynthesis